MGGEGFVDAIVSAVKDPVLSPLAVLISCNLKSEKLKMKKKLNGEEKFKIVIFYTCMYRERENCC